MSHPAVVSFARALGAVHVSVGITLVSSREQVPLAAALLAGLGVFWLGRSYQELPWRDLVLRAYVAPVSVPAFVHLWVASPPTWDVGLDVLVRYAAGVVFETPRFVYLLVLAFSCLVAADRRGRSK